MVNGVSQSGRAAFAAGRPEIAVERPRGWDTAGTGAGPASGNASAETEAAEDSGEGADGPAASDGFAVGVALTEAAATV
jgi:hypothetical protein